MILIKNSQRSITIDTDKLQRELQYILTFLGYKDFDLGIWITTNTTIRRYNKQYRFKDKPTNILSFSFYPNVTAGEKIIATDQDGKNLGDLIISAEYVQRDAKQLNITFDACIRLLVIHGICHLLGYDHETESDYARMQAEETRILNFLNQK